MNTTDDTLPRIPASLLNDPSPEAKARVAAWRAARGKPDPAAAPPPGKKSSAAAPPEPPRPAAAGYAATDQITPDEIVAGMLNGMREVAREMLPKNARVHVAVSTPATRLRRRALWAVVAATAALGLVTVVNDAARPARELPWVGYDCPVAAGVEVVQLRAPAAGPLVALGCKDVVRTHQPLPGAPVAPE